MMTASTLQQLIQFDPTRMRMLEQVRALALPDCWIGAGFVRNAVWDHLHRRPACLPGGDVDVIWYDPLHCATAVDAALEVRLRAADASVEWSVKNQARMHLFNGDAQYGSVLDAMRFWPETATAVAVRLGDDGGIEIAAPYGLDDLFAGLVRPTAQFTGSKRVIFDARWQGKRWLEKWPRLRLALI
ncbi:MAG: nucleotidyltransferase family protein [Pseudomonadota bacterium]